MIKKDRIYHTEYFRNMYENSAQKNILNELELLYKKS